MPKTLSEPYWYLFRAPPHSTSNIGSPSLGSSASTALFMRTLSWNRPVLVSITGRIFFHAATTFKLSGCFFDSSLRHYVSIACRFGITFQLHCSLFHYFWACGVPLTCRVYWPPTAPPESWEGCYGAAWPHRTNCATKPDLVCENVLEKFTSERLVSVPRFFALTVCTGAQTI